MSVANRLTDMILLCSVLFLESNITILGVGTTTLPRERKKTTVESWDQLPPHSSCALDCSRGVHNTAAVFTFEAIQPLPPPIPNCCRGVAASAI